MASVHAQVSTTGSNVRSALCQPLLSSIPGILMTIAEIKGNRRCFMSSSIVTLQLPLFTHSQPPVQYVYEGRALHIPSL